MVETSFLGVLVKKLSFAREVENHKKVSTGAVQKDIFRQMEQVSKNANGDIFSGKGVTKSGVEG